jgi:hypothetical protein
MALATSGALSFSTVVAEFGGTAPHSLSEYYDLTTQGITGLPDITDPVTPFNIGAFYGKDKDFIKQVWTPSTSESSTWVSAGIVAYAEASANTHYYGNNSNMTVLGVSYSNVTSVTFAGDKRYVRVGSGTVDDREGANASFSVRRDNWVTTVTDTSGYVATPAVAQITT